MQGEWEFATNPPTNFPASSQELNWSRIRVPAHWEMEGFVCDSGRGAYRRDFTIPADWQGRRIKFRAEAIYSRASVFVNGRRAGMHEGGTTPFEFDITDASKPGATNRIEILVQARSESSDRLDCLSFFSYFELAGIWRPLEVFCVEPVHPARLTYATTFDPSFTDATLSVDIDLANEQSAPAKTVGLRLRLYDPEGKAVETQGLSTTTALDSWERKRLTLQTTVKSPRQWTAETPELYTLAAEVDGVPVVRQSVGFRQVEVKGKVFLLNGKPVKMWGISRLEAHPLQGRALSRQVIKQDMDMMKAVNANAIRMTICPPDPYSLDLADADGFYVEDEGAYCWASGQIVNDLRYAPLIMGLSSEYLERDRGHPSIVLWSLENESSFGRGFLLTHDLFRKSDPTRPTSAGDYRGGNTEIATYHNPTSLRRLEEAAGFSKPVFFDEAIAAFHGWGMADQIEQDPGLRDFWVTGPIEVRRAIDQSTQIMGVQLFSWVDDNFLVPGKSISVSRRGDNRISYVDSIYKLPGRGVVGDYVWGILDGWRRPRPRILANEEALLADRDRSKSRWPFRRRANPWWSA